MTQKPRASFIGSAGLFFYTQNMNECIERLVALGYEHNEAASICMMLLKEGGDKNLFAYVREAEDVAVLQS